MEVSMKLTQSDVALIGAVVIAATEARRYQSAMARARKHLREFEASGDEYGIGWKLQNPHWKAFRSAYDCAEKWARYLSHEQTGPQLVALTQSSLEASARRDDRIHRERDAEIKRLQGVIRESARNRAMVTGH
jgi:hypothetical protein